MDLEWNNRWRARLWTGLALLGAGMTAAAFAGDWPQWGGSPARNQYSPETGLPALVDPGQTKSGSGEIDPATTRNLKWAVRLGSLSYGNPTVAGGRVFVGTNNEAPRDPRHTGDRSILAVFNAADGGFLWQLVIPKLADKFQDNEGLGLLSSPTVEQDRVYLVSSRCEVLCLDVHGLADGNAGPFQEEAQYAAGPGQPGIEPGLREADIIWRFDMLAALKVAPHNAANCSVLVAGDLLFVGTSNGLDDTHTRAPSPQAPSLIALDKKTGRLVAQDREGIGSRLFHSQWSSPAAGEVGGRTLIFFGAGDGFCYAFDAQPGAQGTLEKRWQRDCNPPGYRVRNGQPVKYSDPEGPSEINATPVFYKNRVYVAIGQDPEMGDGAGNLVCLEATGSGDPAAAGTVWSRKDIHRSLSTAAIDPATGLLFIADFAGFLYCLEADTGKSVWVHDLKAHVWGSPLVADGKVYIGDEDGDFAVLAARREKKVISETSFGGPIYSTPVAANHVLYVATQTHLYAFEEQGQPGR